MTERIAKLALADGTLFEGRAFGADTETTGEAVFNTSMTGYQEVLTDPSYAGQIVAMTYPHIGNYGICDDDRESSKPHVEGFIVRSLCRRPSNFRSQMSLDDYLKQHGIPGIEGIDTRALVRRLRVRGAMPAVITTLPISNDDLMAKAKQAPGMAGRDMVREVMPSAGFGWSEGLDGPFTHRVIEASGPAKKRVVALDYGMKWNILRCLTEAGCEVTVLPGSATAKQVLDLAPDGVFLSNGPGDPEALDYALDTIRGVMGKQPIFGICLGHQLLGRAFGGKTFKLKFGHRGANHPVLDRTTGKVEITTQNHGFAVDPASLPAEIEATHINLNDNTLEGLQHRDLPIFGVQYHPESSAGPHDSTYLFERFMELMKRK